jgi:hypothetical protein
MKRAQSYNLAHNIMPTSAVIMKNSKITFGVLPDPKANLDSNKDGHFNIGFEDTPL